MASKTSNTISRAEFDALVTRTTLLEAQIALLQSAPTAKKVRKTKAPVEGEEKKVRKPSPWIEHSSRVSKLLADEEHADAKAAVGKARLAFCSHLKEVCSGDYESLTDETILEQALSYVAPEGKVKKPAAEEPAEEPAPAPAPAPAPVAKKTPVKKAKAAEEAPAAPKKAPAPAAKKVAKKAAGGSSASESEAGDF
jgi:hypothetical protein